MNKATLLQRLTDIEWDDFEVKKASHELPKNVWETVSAFSNAAGGWIVFGVLQQGKKYEIVGTENPEKIEQDFTTTLRSKQKFNLVIMPECRKYIIDGMTVLAFYIPSADKKPVYFNALQNTFIRTASGDQRATEHEINALYRDQSFGSMSAKTVEGTTPNSLNPSSYKNFRDYLKRMVPELSYNALDDETFNRKLQIVKDGKLTYGGLLMFGRNEDIQDSFPDFRVDYLEIPGLSYADAEPRYTYRIQEQENLWEYYFILFQRIRLYADNPLYIGDMGIGYEDTKQQIALREALVNLLMHSDFFSPMKPRIRVFTNRIEFENPGALPRPVKELLNEDVTIPRNPVIAKLFRIANLCENAGYGFDKMLAWKTETRQEVTFETWVDKTKVTFMLKDGIVFAPKPQENHKKTTRKPQENHKKTTRKPEEIRAAIMKLLEEDATISASNIARQLNISYASVRHHIEILRKEKVVRRVGADKGGYWIVITRPYE
jgi:ATP-dependent DNA helicase RecG